MIKVYLYIILFLVGTYASFAQTDPENLQVQFDSLAKTQPGLNQKVQVNVSGVTLSDFISAIALENNLNVSIDKSLDEMVVNNFYDALVKDVFIFVTQKFDLEVDFIGSIIHFKPKIIVPEPVPVIPPKKIVVDYNPDNDFLSVDLRNDSLIKVARAITKASGKNVIIAPEIMSKMVTVYVENRPFDQVIEMLAKSNGMTSDKNTDGYHYLTANQVENVSTSGRNTNNRGRNNNRSNQQQNGTLSIERSPDQTTINLQANDEPIERIIKEAAAALEEHYFMYDVPSGNTNLDVNNIGFEELLHHVMRGTEFTFKKTDKFYIIGQRNTEGLRASRLIQLENRTIETVIDLIPGELLKDVEVKEFVELNGLIVSGSYIKIEELEAFLRSVDQVVPMIQIDIIIVTSSKESRISTGINAGVANEPVTTNGTVFPGLDVTLGAESINSIIQALNGFGVVNFGLVTPNFYLSLDALESNSVIDIASTPKLSALNGHEATITIGETQYYQQETVQITPNISGGNTLSNRVWVPITANLTVTIKPFLSTDGFVTLEIDVQQDDFTPRSAPEAPPGNSTQTFQSLVRVKDGEMILMGGLEKDSKSESGSGTPFLSRVPVLKWLFSSRTKEKEKSKLHIFIKPTVTY